MLNIHNLLIGTALRVRQEGSIFPAKGVGRFLISVGNTMDRAAKYFAPPTPATSPEHPKSSTILQALAGTSTNPGTESTRL